MISNSLARKYIKFDIHQQSIKSTISTDKNLFGKIKTTAANSNEMFTFGNQNAKKSNGSFHNEEIKTE